VERLPRKKGVSSMRKNCHAVVVAVLLALVMAGLGAGCSKAKRPFKVPNIKMITSEYVYAIAEPEDGYIWLVADYGVIMHSRDGGRTWEEQHSGVSDLLCDVQFVDRSTGWISGIKGIILHTSDGGATWVRQDVGTERHLLSISFVDSQHGWAVGDFTTIMHTGDGGATWGAQSEEQDQIYSKVFFVDRNNGWIVGERGTILNTVNGGTDWHPVVPEFFERESLEDEYDRPRPTQFGIYFTDTDNGWLCGLDSTILHTSDGGATWDVRNTGQDILFNIAVRGDRGWAVGSQGTYLLSRDGGITWVKEEESIKSKLTFSNLHFTSPLRGWVVGAAGTVVHTADGGETWEFYSGLSYEFEGIKMPEGLEKSVVE
jgi:photosystem II stability/assembly factor-like uncharacterized protein